ncbi:MAG TPA: cob(I)yrinic acid a,c-diamide adenosyltransferase [Candidatus Coprocola pullicola]|nr:cob(I)yrinic acid a,c-diamide adenosyltransferase [Candidatus Coprocola pullicola]
MRKGSIFVYYGTAKGKTSLAIGRGICSLGKEQSVVMIQFMKHNSNIGETTPLKRLEPDFKVFHFEKMRYDDTEDAIKQGIANEVRNAFTFAKKILETGECDVLILNGLLDAVTEGYLTAEEVLSSLAKRTSYMDVLLIGQHAEESILQQADFVYHIVTEKESEV